MRAGVSGIVFCLYSASGARLPGAQQMLELAKTDVGLGHSAPQVSVFLLPG